MLLLNPTALNKIKLWGLLLLKNTVKKELSKEMSEKYNKIRLNLVRLNDMISYA